MMHLKEREGVSTQAGTYCARTSSQTCVETSNICCGGNSIRVIDLVLRCVAPIDRCFGNKES